MRTLWILVVVVVLAGACAESAPAPTATRIELTTPDPSPSTEEPAASPAPAGRRSHGMVSLGDGRLLVVGGQTIAANSEVWLGDSWVFDTSAAGWEEAPGVTPRGQIAVAHDAHSNETLLFGGYAGGSAVYGDTYRRGRDDWVRVDQAGPLPARTGSAMAFDDQSGVYVLFGGAERPFVAELPSNDTWRFDPAAGTWQQMEPETAPRPVAEGHPTLFELAMVYHVTADRMILLIGGHETWAYDVDGDVWEPRAAPGLDADFMVAAAYHGGLDRVIAYGGGPTAMTQETWAYDYTADRWDRIATSTSPGPVGDHAMAYDPLTDRVYLFGGSDDLLPLDTPDVPSASLWSFDGTTWVLVAE